VGGIGSQPGLDNVASVARGHPIALDPAGSERIKRESPAPKSFQAEGDSDAPATVVAASTSSGLNAEQARAVLITRLLSLMNGKTGVRLQVAEFLKELLNQNIVPALPAADDAAALGAVADACKGLGSIAATSQQLSAALEASGVSAPGISAAERAAISNGAAASAGVGSLVVVGAKQLLTVVTAVAALSCEAAGAQVSCAEQIFLLFVFARMLAAACGTSGMRLLQPAGSTILQVVACSYRMNVKTQSLPLSHGLSSETWRGMCLATFLAPSQCTHVLPCVPSCEHVFEADVVEALGYKGTIVANVHYVKLNHTCYCLLLYAGEGV
jgi:hypothetical protein